MSRVKWLGAEIILKQLNKLNLIKNMKKSSNQIGLN